MRKIQTNFTGGELSPRLYGRVDLDKYYNAAERIENFIVHPHGGAARRPGTYFVAETKDSAKQSRLVPFRFSVVQNYILEFGDLYVRFYALQGQVLDGGAPLEIATPYAEAEINKLKFTQSADILYICHPDFKPRKLMRQGATTWSIEEIDEYDGPYLVQNVDTGWTLTPSATSGSSITITASQATFAATDVGRLVRIQNGDPEKWGAARITAFGSSTSVTAESLPDRPFGGTTASSKFRLGAWSDTTGYPYVATFYEERLTFAGNDNQPFALWFSRSGDFENFSPSDPDGTVADDHGLTYSIASDEVNAIRWLSAGKRLGIGTDGAEWTLGSGSGNEPLSPTNVEADLETTFGSAELPTIKRVESAVLFIQRADRKVREWVYSFEIDNFVGPDMTILAEHITAPGIFELDYAQEPDSILWCARGDGALLGLTYERDQDVNAWHKHWLGGEFEGAKPVVESVATIPSSDGSYDETWLLVMRTINGVQRRYVEFMTPAFEGNTIALIDAFFVDCGLSYLEATPANEFSNLDHLEGQEVSILADGAVRPNQTVTGGKIVLDRPASRVHVGLPYTSILHSLPFEVELPDGTAQARSGRISRLWLFLHETVGCKFGASEDKLESIPFRSTSDKMDTATPLFSGKKQVSFPKGPVDEGPQVMVVQDLPLPCTALAFVAKVRYEV